MSIDRVSNMLSSIKNASLSQRVSIEVMYTKQCEEVAKVLKQNGYLVEVKSFKYKDSPHKGLRLDLVEEYVNRISDIKRISKPGRRLYASSTGLRKYSSKSTLVVVSTSRGIMSSNEARKKKLGGEVICKVI